MGVVGGQLIKRHRIKHRILLLAPRAKGDVIKYALHFGFSSTNNETKYEALIAGLRTSKELGVQDLKA